MAGYGDDQTFTNWLAAQGLALPANHKPPAVLREIGSTYIDAAYEPRLFCSQRADPFTQGRAWPRIGAQLGGRDIPPDLVPVPWINASYRAAWLDATQAGWAQSGLDPSRMTKREKAGQVEREFFAAGEGGVIGNAAQGFRVDPLIDAMLSGWLCDDAQAGPQQLLWSVGR